MQGPHHHAGYGGNDCPVAQILMRLFNDDQTAASEGEADFSAVHRFSMSLFTSTTSSPSFRLTTAISLRQFLLSLRGVTMAACDSRPVFFRDRTRAQARRVLPSPTESANGHIKAAEAGSKFSQSTLLMRKEVRLLAQCFRYLYKFVGVVPQQE